MEKLNETPVDLLEKIKVAMKDHPKAELFVVTSDGTVFLGDHKGEQLAGLHARAGQLKKYKVSAVVVKAWFDAKEAVAAKKATEAATAEAEAKKAEEAKKADEIKKAAEAEAKKAEAAKKVTEEKKAPEAAKPEEPKK